MKRRTFCGSALAAAALSPFGSRLLAAAAAPLGQVITDIRAVTGAGGETILAKSDVEALKASLRGQLLLPGNDGYDQARRLWNAAFDKRPALIARCAGAADVRAAVNFAKAHDLLLAVRGGGHSTSGHSVCEGGLMLDLSPMRAVRVDPLARRARVEPGVLLGQFDREAQAFGLVTTAGTVSHTGAAGLTLGGGFGRLGRHYALACDNLTGVDVITAGGQFVRANARENPDLFWGTRGGGGNFGVVTSFEYQLHAMSPTIMGGWIDYPIEQARDVLRLYAEYALAAPDELNADLSLLANPGGMAVVSIEVCYSGPPALAEQAIRPLRKLGKPTREDLRPMPYVELQASGDDDAPVGLNYYIKSGFITALNGAGIEALVAPYLHTPLPRFGVTLAQLGGAIGRVPEAQTAFAHRDARWDLVIVTGWKEQGQGGEQTQAVRSYWDSVKSLTKGFYVNTMSADDDERVQSNYRGNYDRLVKLKNRYDPTNLFRLNANIRPDVKKA